MKTFDFFRAAAFAVMALLFYVVVIHLHFVALPVGFMVLGLLSYAWDGKKSLMLFLFLLPLVNATPDLFFNGYPFNYMGIPLFYLSGILCASLLKGEKPARAFPGRNSYLLFATLLGVSALFVFSRWSNLGLPAVAFLRDTPVAPSGERISFACIFPAITLALFFLAPWLAALIRHRRLDENEIFAPLKAGFCLSFLLALFQKWVAPGFMSQSWWGVQIKQVNGGFSDFNAFGFFAGALFLYQVVNVIEKLPPPQAGRDKAGPGGGTRLRRLPGDYRILTDILFLAVALAAIFISGCRTAFLFVLLALFRLLSSKKIDWFAKTASVLLLAVSLFILGSTLHLRLSRMLAQVTRVAASADLFHAADEISNGRLVMLKDSMRMLGRFPVSGVGAGNFLFYLKYLRFEDDAYFDLPLNQYLLIFSETGLAGGLAFLFFLATLLRRQKPGRVRSILAAMAFALLFNNFFWFPEALLLFWLFVARAEWPAATAARNPGAWRALAVLLFIAMCFSDFQALHPKTWARKTSTSYDYGFSYPEMDHDRRVRWTGAAAGVYLHIDPGRDPGEYLLFCGAPLAAFKRHWQIVDIYWRGKLLKKLVFKQNSHVPLQFDAQGAREGFLEFRVSPVFNLMRMGLGRESRDLGIQVSGKGI